MIFYESFIKAPIWDLREVSVKENKHAMIQPSHSDNV